MSRINPNIHIYLQSINSYITLLHAEQTLYKYTTFFLQYIIYFTLPFGFHSAGLSITRGISLTGPLDLKCGGVAQ